MEPILLTKVGSFKTKVSSTLQPSGLYASKHMFDGNPETCWNSDQGTPQYILIDFQRSISVSEIRLTFQGGFVGQECSIEIGDAADKLAKIEKHLDFLDINDKQVFPFIDEVRGRVLKLIFGNSTDFYGRVTIYSYEVYGQES